MSLGQISIILIAITLWLSGYSGAEIAPLMALIILVVSRIIPNVNKLVNDLNGIWAAYPHVMSLEKHDMEFLNLPKRNNLKITKKLTDFSNLEFKNVYFNYINSKEYILKNINLRFEKGKSYGIVGKSGAGKSTFIDLIIGLLEPSKGKVFINGSNIKSLIIKTG